MTEASDEEFASWEPLFDTGSGQEDNEVQQEDESKLEEPFVATSSGEEQHIMDQNADDDLNETSSTDDKIMLPKKKQKLIIDTNIGSTVTVEDDSGVGEKESDTVGDLQGKRIASVESMGRKTPVQVQSPSFLDNMFATFRNDSTPADAHVSRYSMDISDLAKSPATGEKNHIVTSPNIISHRRESSISSRRKTSRARKTSNDSLVSMVTSPLQKAPQPAEVISHLHSNNHSVKDLTEEDENQSFVEDEENTNISTFSDVGSVRSSDEYNRRRFIEEKYSDTDYHYPTIERDADFHKVFEGIPSDDRLIDDFSCALTREFLYQGRLYVSEKSLCFNSNILGWVAKVIIPIKNVRYIEKTSSVGLFPNAILIETDEEKIQFNNFISREQVFKLIKAIWSKNLVFADLDKEETPKKEKRDMPINRTKSSYDVDHNDDFTEKNNDDEYDEDEDVDEKVLNNDNLNESLINGKEESTSTGHYRFKKGVNYINEPPYTNDETSFPDDKEENEFILKTLDLSCTPLQAYQIMFSDKNYSYLYDFLKANNSSDIEEPTNFDNINKRTYSYEKSLNIPGGPKSTKCYAEEDIINYDTHSHIMVISTTKTPNVTSGNAFATKTRYLYRWGPNNSCQLQVSYWLNWTGSSWFKKMIEAGAKKGQIEATEKMVDIINDYVKNNIISSDKTDEESTFENTEMLSQPVMKSDKLIKPDLEMNIKTNNNMETSVSSTTLMMFAIIIIVLLLFNIWYQISTRRTIRNIEKLLMLERKL